MSGTEEDEQQQEEQSFFSSDYFNIDDIISEQELMPVSFQSNVYFVNPFFSAGQVPLFIPDSQSQTSSSMSQPSSSMYDDDSVSQTSNSEFSVESSVLNGNGQQQQGSVPDKQKFDRIKKNSRMELPLWLSAVLTQQGHVSVMPPKCFSTLEQLEAEATTCNARGMNKYYFVFGSQVSELLTVAGSSAKYRQFGERMSQVLTPAFKKRFLKILNEAQNATSHNYSEATKRLTTTELLVFEAGREGVEEFNSYKQTCGYENLNSSSKASLWDMSSSSDSFNARDFYNRTKQLDEEHAQQEEVQERYRKRALLSDGTTHGTL